MRMVGSGWRDARATYRGDVVGLGAAPSYGPRVMMMHGQAGHKARREKRRRVTQRGRRRRSEAVGSGRSERERERGKEREKGDGGDGREEENKEVGFRA